MDCLLLRLQEFSYRLVQGVWENQEVRSMFWLGFFVGMLFGAAILFLAQIIYSVKKYG